jgi:SAM-dependent methyltransferase
MSHRTTGLYRILERPGVYERFQRLLGARRSRARFVDEFLKPFGGASLLDIGCGTASLLDDLPADVDYTGFDLNPAYIEAAQRRYGSRGRFLCARVGREGNPVGAQEFDFVVAKGLIHHLDDEEAHLLLESARKVLRPGGVFVSMDNVFHEGQRWIARLLTSLDRGGRVRSPQDYSALVEAHFEDVQTRLVSDMMAVPYDHFIIRARAT